MQPGMSFQALAEAEHPWPQRRAALRLAAAARAAGSAGGSCVAGRRRAVTKGPARAPIEGCLAALQAALADARHEGVCDRDLRRLLTAAVRLYAARAAAREIYPAPVAVGELTATDVVVTVSEMIRAVDLNLFDLSMWFNRARPVQGRPE